MCDPAKIFITSEFSYLLFLHLTHVKLKLRTANANRSETSNSKSPPTIIIIDQSEIGNSSLIIFVTLFSRRCEALLCLLHQAQQSVC